MKELRCPHCKEVFQVDDAAFESIASQVRSAEFEAELHLRAEELKKSLSADFEVSRERVRNEFEKKLLSRESDLQKRDNEISLLKERMAAIDSQKSLEMTNLLAKKDADIQALKRQLEQRDDKQRIVLLEQQKENDELLKRKDEELADLRNSLERQRLEAEAKRSSLEVEHQNLIKAKDKEIDLYKSFRTGLSVKLIGEDLEQHCAVEFERAQANGLFPCAAFGKDNDTRPGGTKGDFIFRDYIGVVEYISIMFEMKNEDPESVNKHKNIDFLAKLDKDRTEKGCEYAVLVTMLEKENELYNKGIVNMSHRYPKMYIIRPSMFIELTALLCQASKKGFEEIASLKDELAVARSQSIDITNFEKRRDQFVEQFTKLVNDHQKKHNDAMDEIDKVIAALEKQAAALRKVKGIFETSNQKIIKAGDAAENNFTIKKLTYGNPTMKARFEEARRISASNGGEIPDTAD